MKPILGKTDPETRKSAESVFRSKKVALFVVTYNASRHIRETLSRIPEWCRPLFAETYVIDDSSKDDTAETALAAGNDLGLTNFSVMTTPGNQGYGGNQKIGYAHAIGENHDIVILLHGDGQYPPERLPEIVARYSDESIDAVFGSRMTDKLGALRGGMPLYKWFGNQILTGLENAMLGSSLSEFHNGYRSYRIDILKRIPFESNSDGFHFDTDIIIQILLAKGRIAEIPMPTHYGDEECHVDGIRYARNCIKSALKSRLHRAGLFFQPNFEMPGNADPLPSLKMGSATLHQHVISLDWKPGESVADFGIANRKLSEKISEKGPRVVSIEFGEGKSASVDRFLTKDSADPKESFDKALALDAMEHLRRPEDSAERVHRSLKPGGTIYASTANVGYFVTRLALLLGWFNYGKKGILDRTHYRLFTIGSFRRLLENSGFDILEIRGFGPPITDSFGDSLPWKATDRICALMARIYPRLFAFQFLVIAKKRLSVREKLRLSRKNRLKS